jgi:hypothetical protein
LLFRIEASVCIAKKWPDKSPGEAKSDLKTMRLIINRWCDRPD